MLETKDDAPHPGPGPSPVPAPPNPFDDDPYWVALGNPPKRRIYISTQGDCWDLIAIRVYGRKRGNEHLMFRLLEENYLLREVAIFPAGVVVFVPEVNIATEIVLVPWKKALQLPST